MLLKLIFYLHNLKSLQNNIFDKTLQKSVRKKKSHQAQKHNIYV